MGVSCCVSLEEELHLDGGDFKVPLTMGFRFLRHERGGCHTAMTCVFDLVHIMRVGWGWGVGAGRRTGSREGFEVGFFIT